MLQRAPKIYFVFFFLLGFSIACNEKGLSGKLKPLVIKKTVPKPPSHLHLTYNKVEPIRNQNGEIMGCKVNATAYWRMEGKKTQSELLVSEKQGDFDQAIIKRAKGAPHITQRYDFVDYVLAKGEIHYLGVCTYHVNNLKLTSDIVSFEQVLRCNDSVSLPVVGIEDLTSDHVKLSYTQVEQDEEAAIFRFDIDLKARVPNATLTIVLLDQAGEPIAKIPTEDGQPLQHTFDAVQEKIKLRMQIVIKDKDNAAQIKTLDMGDMTLLPLGDNTASTLQLACETKKKVVVGINPNQEPNMPYLAVKFSGPDVKSLQVKTICSSGGCRINLKEGSVAISKDYSIDGKCVITLQDVDDPEHFIIKMIEDGTDSLRMYRSKKLNEVMTCEASDAEAFARMCD